MKKQRIFLIIFIFLVIIFAVYKYSQSPSVQHLDKAFITVKAPLMNRSVLNENAAKENAKNNIEEVIFYHTSSGGIEYVVTFSKNKEEINFNRAINSIKKTFQDYNFQFTKTDTKSGVYIEGTFNKNGTVYGVKDLMIKNKNFFWQILTIYPNSKKNADKADKFIKSAMIDDKKIRN
ncbi:hypothetical protein [Endomicrobium proavitum]|uniref:Uncharacterized protein n=1 Tax=Endomicrobium proavitum TaxID=1408281 RepID=A0A0G3WGI8_9BACT|nr:hypothetical protein [Endomicrobium proavitum]AKL97796.1 exported protein of unknown function [Endomicrobium proavitum]